MLESLQKKASREARLFCLLLFEATPRKGVYETSRSAVVYIHSKTVCEISYIYITFECHGKAFYDLMKPIPAVFVTDTSFFFGIVGIKMFLNGYYFVLVGHGNGFHPGVIRSDDINRFKSGFDGEHYSGDKYIAGTRHGQTFFEKEMIDGSESLRSDGIETFDRYRP